MSGRAVLICLSRLNSFISSHDTGGLLVRAYDHLKFVNGNEMQCIRTSIWHLRTVGVLNPHYAQ